MSALSQPDMNIHNNNPEHDFPPDNGHLKIVNAAFTEHLFNITVLNAVFTHTLMS